MPAKGKLKAKGMLHRSLCEEWKARRIELKLTQQQVADALGICQPAYADIESGRSAPTITQIERVSKALKLQPSIEFARAG